MRRRCLLQHVEAKLDVAHEVLDLLTLLVLDRPWSRQMLLEGRVDREDVGEMGVLERAMLMRSEIDLHTRWS